MKKVILFGATGHLGKAIAKELVRQQYQLTIVARSKEKAQKLSAHTTRYIIADPLRKESLRGICAGQEIVISALGKSVSVNDFSKPGFEEVDLQGNLNILDDAQQSGVKKFVYVSAFHAEKFPHIVYFRVHHQFSETLKNSGMDYSIIKPPALFSAFLDMLPMAAKGMLVNMGKGDKKTNPIYEGDLAKIIVASIDHAKGEVEAGGKKVYTRRELNEVIQRQVNSRKKLRTVPLAVVMAAKPLVRLFSKNMYDKLAFILEVFREDTIAPRLGETSFEAYIEQHAGHGSNEIAG